MALDPYSPCPGGTGKKVKFCCNDLLADLEKIQRMIEGDQRLACLKHIESLEKTHPGRACLLAMKSAVLGQLGRGEELVATIETFLEQHPNNPVALADSAMITVSREGPAAGVMQLQRAIEACTEQMPTQVFESIGGIARLLLSTGYPLAAKGHLLLQAALVPNDEQVVNALMQLNASTSLPVLFKEAPRFDPCPDNVPWRDRFEAAMRQASRGLWQRASEELAALTHESPETPALWHNLAVLRGWLADSRGAVQALRRYAALDVSLDDAVEAEALAQLIDEDLEQPMIDVVEIEYPVEDIERLMLTLTSDRRANQIPVDAQQHDEGPPPRAIFVLLDRPQPETGVDITLDAIPQALGYLSVYGKQTDRPARLEYVVNRNEQFDSAKRTLEELAGDSIGPAGKEEVLDQRSKVQDELSVNWRLPDDTPYDHRVDLIGEHRRKVILDRWPDLSLPVLDGKTPSAVASDPSYRVRLLAAILVLEMASQRQQQQFDFNELRRKLNQPEAGPISPAGLDLDAVPLVRLHRLKVAELSDDQLWRVYLRAAGARHTPALRVFAEELVSRPSLDGRMDKAEAYGILADSVEDTRETLKYLNLARDEAVKQGQSSASWDLAELTVRLARGEPEEFSRLLNHLSTEHINEPGVRQALMQVLASAGLIGPDGRLRGMPAGAAPGGPMPVPTPTEAPAAEAGGIWTPGEEAPGGEKKSGLWLPGMD